MSTIKIAVLAVVAVLGGLGGIIAVDRAGWLQPGVEVDADRDWCAEHGVPESECALCKAEGAAALPAPFENPDGLQVTITPTGLRSDRAPSEGCSNAFTTLTLADDSVAGRAGLGHAPVVRERFEQAIICNAEIEFDARRRARLASRAPGIIAEVLVDLGDEVERGQVLAVVESVELGSAKSMLLEARTLVELWERNVARQEELFEQNVTTVQEVLDAETKLVEHRVPLSSARQRLINLGLSEAQIDAVAAEEDRSPRLSLVAPFPGTVIERHFVAGEVVDSNAPILSVADTSLMWAMLDVPETDVAALKLGAPVRVELDALPGRTVEGTITWMSASVDTRTRTLEARAVVDNADRLLRAHMYGRGEIVLAADEEAVVVPESALQWDGCCNVVFVRHTNTVYQSYPVTVVARHEGRAAVTGLGPGESVVTEGSFLLKTEILKGNIGAGCCEVDPGADR